MKCPHCSVTIHDESNIGNIFVDSKHISKWAYKYMSCPACSGDIISIGRIDRDSRVTLRLQDEYLAYPKSISTYERVRFGAEVPEDMRNDYREACDVVSISPKASAALSRRTLQSILLKQDYTSRNLVDQIQAVLDEKDSSKSLPTSLKQTIDAIRNFGNFSAHPITDKSSLQIVDVEHGESEWCLEIVEQLFDHYYVRPAANAKQIAELDKKLANAGKPPMKS